MTDALSVTPNSRVLAHYILYLADGSVADNTYHNEAPVRFVLGDGSLSEALETQLLNLKVGDKKTIELQPKDAFGMPQETSIYSIPRSQFPEDMDLEEGLIVGFSQPNGVELPGVIRRMLGDLIVVDFNHPLAGQAVKFEMEILAIE